MRKIAWIRDDAAVPCIRQAIELDYSSGALWDALLHIGSPVAGEAIEALAQTSNAELAALAKARLVEFRRRRLRDLATIPPSSKQRNDSGWQSTISWREMPPDPAGMRPPSDSAP